MTDVLPPPTIAEALGALAVPFGLQVAVLLTLGYLFWVASVARPLLPSEERLRAGFVGVALWGAVPGVLAAGYVFLLLWRWGLPGFSELAVWLFLLVELILLLRILAFSATLRRLRVHPWTEARFVWVPARSIGVRALRMLYVEAPSLPYVLVLPRDLGGALGGDLRRVDWAPVEAEDAVEGSQGAGGNDLLCLSPRVGPPCQPHFSGIADEAPASETRRGVTPSEWQPVALSGAAEVHQLNRRLNSRLSAELWRASQKLCRMPPRAVASSWRNFHAQRTLRLRLVCLFNTADLLQRILTIAVVSHLRNTGRLLPKVGAPAALARGQGGDWNRLLRDSLAGATSDDLMPLRRVLLRTRDDLGERAQPLWAACRLVGVQVETAKTLDAVGGLRVLAELRNRLIGHGGVGWRLSLAGSQLLDVLHPFFLAAVQEIAEFDLGIRIYDLDEANLLVRSVAVDQGTAEPPLFEDDCRPHIHLGPAGPIYLDPYVRLHHGRVLFLNRVRDKAVQYVDYESANAMEPSFVSLEISPSRFFEDPVKEDQAFFWWFAEALDREARANPLGGERWTRSTVKVREALAAHDPADGRLQESLANDRLQMAAAARRAGRTTEELDWIRQAVTGLEAAVEHRSDVSYDQFRLLCRARYELALGVGAEERAARLAAYLSLVDLCDRVNVVRSSDRRTARTGVDAHLRGAELLRDLEPARARQLLARALDLCREWVVTAPETVDAWSALAATCEQLWMHESSRDDAVALVWNRSAMDALDKGLSLAPADARLRSALARCIQRSARPANDDDST